MFFYRQYERLMAHWRKVLPTDKLIEVDYEALVADPEPQTRQLLSACGLDWNDACLAPASQHAQGRDASVRQVRQPIFRTSVSAGGVTSPGSASRGARALADLFTAEG